MSDLMSITRRSALAGLGAISLTAVAGAHARAASAANRKLIIVILRGALDGLSAAPKLDDPHIEALRADLVPDGALPLGDGFALHPELKTMHGLYQAGEMALLHAAAGPWRDRSHFLAQDLLESGTATTPTGDGWLNRAMLRAPAPLAAVSIGPTQPLILRGAAETSSWSPPALPEASEDTIARLMDLYAGDALLGPALAQALETDAVAGDMAMGQRARGPGAQFGYAVALEAVGRLMAAEGGPDIGVVSLDGWDTHSRQNTFLTPRLRALDAGLDRLKQALGPAWPRTAVALVTEFGRTVAENGGQGTDHGTGGVAFLLGGGVRGGRILGDWPGLAPRALYEGRDLYPANDLTALFTGLLMEGFGHARADLERDIFPGSAAPAMTGLLA